MFRAGLGRWVFCRSLLQFTLIGVIGMHDGACVVAAAKSVLFYLVID
jgi:hypothetical protein